MDEGQLPRRIKPPRHYYSWKGDIPSYPVVPVGEAVDRLLEPNLEKRGLERATINDFRGLFEELLRREPDPDEFPYLFFHGVVVNCYGDLRGFQLPFELGFADAYFLEDLDLGEAQVEALSLSGHYIHGSLSLVNLEGSPRLSLQNVQADQVYLYGGQFPHLTFGGLKAGSVTLGKCSVERRLEFHQGCEFYDILWFDDLTTGGGLYVSDSRVHELLRIRDVESGSSIELSESHLVGPIEIQRSSCELLSFRESIVSSTADLRGLEFDQIDVLGAQLPGRILLDPHQLRQSSADSGSKWDTPSKMEANSEAGSEELSAAADQLSILRERFHSMPSMTDRADYCAYRMKEITRQLTTGKGPRALRWIEKRFLGYMIALERLVGTAVAAVFLFTLLYGIISLLDGPLAQSTLLLSDPTLTEAESVFSMGGSWGWLYCLYLSLASFGTVSLEMLTPVGYVAGLAVIEGVAGGLWIALFVVALARRIVRW